ncbi:MAG TPA: ATP-dependent zinc metalloprotease FtsH [Gemmataceae bacterium]|nr:ATP-dependent zinc metalloprotease FtsH [Gemmataceae bacterium]
MPPRQPYPPPRPSRRRPSPTLPGGWVWIILAIVALIVFFGMSGQGTRKPTTSDFINLAKDTKDHPLAKIDYYGASQVEFELKKGAKLPDNVTPELKSEVEKGKTKFTVPLPAWWSQDGTDSREIQKANPDIPIQQYPEPNAWVTPLVYFGLPVLIFLAFLLFFLPRIRDPMGGGFLSNYIKSPAKRYERSKMRVTFDDVADMQNAKQELQEVVDFLKHPDKFQRLGAQVPKGVLLVGPPGTGKTLLARAVAGEAGVPFYSISGSEFIQMFVGVGASRVRDMFKQAKENAPCLLFVDEIDAVGRMRGAGVGGGSDEREQTLNQILSEMDGFQPNEMVIVIAATNRPDVLDPALLRPGRFDRHVTVDRPTWQGRVEILKVHTRNKPLADDVNLETIARKMIGMTGADLRNLANEAALLATREGKGKIDRQDFERAADRVLMGPKREEVLTEDDKRRTSYHEAGHTLVAFFTPEGDPPQKVTIVPRGRAGGVTFLAIDEERMHHGLDYFKARLAMMMGGRAAERLIYGQPYAGVESDLKQATNLARYMVTHWGMSDRLGPMSFRIGEEHVFLGKEMQEPRDFSEGTAEVIDEEVQRLLREADQQAFDVLEKHRADLDKLADALLHREELYREEIEALLHTQAPANADGHPTEPVFAPGGPK